MVRPLIAGNWKMNGLHDDGVARAGTLAERVTASEPPCEVAVCPPTTLLHSLASVLQASPVVLGAQDCHPERAGAHTGDVSADMLADAGCRYVIVGHSERRREHGESDALVRAKAEAAHRAGLAAIVCIGETEAERDAGRSLTVVEAQLAGSLPADATGANTVIAYEPVWAIGTGRTPSAEDIAAMHARVRAFVSTRLGEAEGTAMRLLYGGSVKPDNATSLLSIADVNGALVGGASLIIEDFWAICRSCP